MKTDFHYDEMEDRVTINRSEDVEPLLNRLASQRAEGYTGSADMKFVGTIPNIIVEKYLNEKGVSMQDFINDDIHIMRIMNDPEYKHLRVWQGRM
jgi:hypothetical protein